MKLVQLKKDDSTWNDFLKSWEKEITDNGEDYDMYAGDTIDLLKHLTDEENYKMSGGRRVCGLFSLYDEEAQKYEAIFQINCAPIPAYDDRVLRVRHINLSPDLDFGYRDITDLYTNILGQIFFQCLILAASNNDYLCKHLKFHAKSPQDIQLFNVYKTIFNLNLLKNDLFQIKTVEMKGAWLYIQLA